MTVGQRHEATLYEGITEKGRFARPFFASLATLLLLICAACQSGHPDSALRTAIGARQLTGDPSLGREIPKIGSPEAQLGKKLFYTKALGGAKDTACVTCHSPLLGGGDGLRLPIGTGAIEPDHLGKGRALPSGLANVPRNAPTTFNSALWDRALFWDGRVESLGKTPRRGGADGLGIRTPDVSLDHTDPLAGDNLVMAQARFPVTSQAEMRGYTFETERPNQAVRQHLAARLGNYGVGYGELEVNRWLPEFLAAFGGDRPVDQLITEQNIARAIAAFEASQVFVATPWRAYVQGDDNALSEAAKRGALLFFKSVAEGGAGCAECHKGDAFTDEEYHVLAVPQIGIGKGDGPTNDEDLGRFRETRNPDDLYAFRTPSLLNVEVTGPYGHDGAYATLEEIVKHHLNPAQAIAGYDFARLEPDVQSQNARFNSLKALSKLQANRAAGLPAIQDVPLNQRQGDDILAFLSALTDPCVKDRSCLAPWLPGPGDADPDGLRIEVN